MTPFLDANSQRAHKARNTLHSMLLVGGLGLLTGFSAWLIWGGMGVAVTLVAIGVIYAFAPRLPPEVLMGMYRARPLDPRNGGSILHIADVLSDRAELPAPPRVYVIPSMTLNAFATGTAQKSMIGVTEGLLRRLTLNELAGVLAHEISHIRNNDLAVMSLADVMTRFTQMLSYLALFLALFNLPAFLLGELGNLLYRPPPALPRADRRQPDPAGPLAHARVRRRPRRRRPHRRSCIPCLGIGKAGALSGTLLGRHDASGSRPAHSDALAAALASVDARACRPPARAAGRPDAAAALHRRGADGVAGRPRPHRHAPALSLDRRVVLSWPCRDLTS